jgi:hypothetical protein
MINFILFVHFDQPGSTKISYLNKFCLEGLIFFDAGGGEGGAISTFCATLNLLNFGGVGGGLFLTGGEVGARGLVEIGGESPTFFACGGGNGGLLFEGGVGGGGGAFP